MATRPTLKPRRILAHYGLLAQRPCFGSSRVVWSGVSWSQGASTAVYVFPATHKQSIGDAGKICTEARAWLATRIK
ncbi:hypothetical protein PgNI_10442 [Pyricularia grisea]|uniref:Uncharacterized protein n=1 Tax=Pyricularia grisea TaxID=148305 RepID=A0A6P8AY69_PYRGI|nr:hypothetical protein PgNI_10442 [Pyricularia grisea]TLD07303.1 hypothetical protein PgNI_10442 [Pyricularia grisea]